MENVCYTFEAAIEKAIEMENEGFRHYLDAVRKVTDKGAREILKDAALDELEHKHQLEKALLEGSIAADGSLTKTVPTMNLEYILKKEELKPDATVRDALAYAIHLENGSIDLYKQMAIGCEGAPMGDVFKRLLADETRHLQSLEDLFERHFMPEN